MSTGSNLEPYLFEDDFYKVNSKNSNRKLETGMAKMRPNASFLLCAGRKSIKTRQKNDLRPFQKTSNRSGMPVHSANGTDHVTQIKTQRISSADNDMNFEKQCTSYVTMRSQRPCFPSHLSSSRVSVGNNVEDSSSLATPSDQGNFFPSVATLRRQHTAFWAGPGTGKARPVSTPQLVGPPVPATQIPGPIQPLRHQRNPVIDLDTCQSCSFVGSPRGVLVNDLNEAVPGPCSIRFISEISCEKKPNYRHSEIPILQSASSGI